jgi:nitrite reductase/ring-hydroxylating ferredoxin subunit
MSDELEREPVSRRDYLGLAGIGSATAAIAFCSVGMLRLPKPRVLPDVSGLLRLGSASRFPPGTSTVLPESKVCVFGTDDGIAVMSLVCTHLGCIVQKTETGFDCPCHGSKFGPQGELVAGPAPRRLPWWAVSQAPDGTILVDLGKEVAAGEADSA